MYILKKYVFVLFIIFCSCRDEFTICELPTDVKIKTGLYEKINGVEKEAVVSNLKISEIVSNLPVYNMDAMSRFNLELNPSIDSAQYKIIINSAVLADTITYVYSSQKVNLSIECGDVFIYNVSRVTTTTHFIDSILISGNTINPTSGENVKIYF